MTKVPAARNDKEPPATNKNNNLPQNDGNAVRLHQNTETLVTTIVPIAKKRKIDNRRDSTNEKSPMRKIGGKEVAASSSSSRPMKKFKKEFAVHASPVSFENIGGIDKILKELCELLLHIKHPDVYKHIGLPPPRGFLLHGPPGSGKTLLAQAIAGVRIYFDGKCVGTGFIWIFLFFFQQLQVGLIQVAATELIGGVSGESEERIRDLFEQAAASAPCVLFIDEIDAISSNRLNAQKDMERRIVAQLLISLDGLSKFERGDQVLVIGATNRADSLDPALRRVGRFDQEICLGIPDRDARGQILRVICNNLRLEKLFDYDRIAALTPGYVGADLLALATRAASLAVKRIFHDKQESVLRESVCKTEQRPTIPEVNLSEDILMDIEDMKTPALPDIEEPELDVETTTASPNTLDNGTLNPTDDQTVKVQSKTENEEETNKSVAEIAAEIVMKTESGDVVMPESENDTDAAKADEVAEKKAEKAEKAEATNRQEEKPAEKPTPVDEGSAINADGSEIVVSSTETNETLGEALLKNSAIKQQMGLDVMFKWLSNTEPLVTDDELKGLYITMDDFNGAIKVVQPSAKREGFITVPDVTWDDIGSLQDIRQELNLAILAPVKFPIRLKMLGLQAPSGVLLCGPPGCGKTLLAKAVANEAGINFISVKGPELLNMYVGESERAVRQCFTRARNSAPCVIFFDEFDALCPKRTGSNDSSASSRVVNQLLTEMDGVEERKGVFLMAATNRPDMVDPAVLRPGRLDKILYVGLPEQNDRLDILRALTKRGTEPTLDGDVCLDDLATRTESFTGADLAGLVRQASLQALKDSISKEAAIDSDDDLKVHKQHFDLALKQLRPSVTPEVSVWIFISKFFVDSFSFSLYLFHTG